MLVLLPCLLKQCSYNDYNLFTLAKALGKDSYPTYLSRATN